MLECDRPLWYVYTLDDILTQKANIKFVSKAMKQPLLSLKDEKKITNFGAKKKM